MNLDSHFYHVVNYVGSRLPKGWRLSVEIVAEGTTIKLYDPDGHRLAGPDDGVVALVREAMRWQPMELAPQDGTKISARVLGQSVDICWRKKRFGVLDAREFELGPGWSEASYYFPIAEPTCWCY